MRTKASPSAIAVGAVFVLLVALVAPAGAAPPGNPFVGSWTSVYLDESNPVGELLGERELRLQIGGGQGHIQGTAEPGGICYGLYEEFMRSSITGWGTITSEDPYIFEGYVDIYCHTAQGKRLAFEDFRVEYQHDPVSDTLVALHYPDTAQFNCAWRTGSDPSVCSPALILSPAVQGADVAAAGQVLADALQEATGAIFTVVAASSHRDAYDRMCASQATAVGITSNLTYSLASVDCGVDASFRAVRFGSDGFYTQFLVPAGSGFQGIGDLDGKSWAHPGPTSTSGYVVPKGMLVLAGVEPSASFDVGSHDETVSVIYNGDADFGTTFFDARTTVEDEYPDVFDKVEILAISPIIPNDGVSFGSLFPEGLRRHVEAALVELADPVDGVWADSLGTLYGWEGINGAVDADWDWLRTVLEAAGFGIDDL